MCWKGSWQSERFGRPFRKESLILRKGEQRMQYLVQMKLVAQSRPTTPEEGVAFVEQVIFPSLGSLVIHGDADRILPITASGLRTAKLIKGARLSVVKDGPHCITWTHADEVNSELVNFLGKGVAQRAVSASQSEAVAFEQPSPRAPRPDP